MRARIVGQVYSCHQLYRRVSLVEAEHRNHAVVEQVIADLEAQALTHVPSGEFNANGAWTVLDTATSLLHNRVRRESSVSIRLVGGSAPR
jgi:hypothetical protein